MADPMSTYTQIEGRSRDYLAGAREILQPGRINEMFLGLQGIANPTINALLQGEALGGQMASQSAMASLGRSGLGSTGLGTVLGSGLRAGAAFRGNQLRARIFQDLLGEATRLRERESGLLGQFGLQLLAGGGQIAGQMAGRPSTSQQILQGLGTGATAASGLGWEPFGSGG